MNFDKLMPFILGVAIVAIAIGEIDTLQKWILKSQIQLLYEAKTSNWGNPMVFKVK